ncbi:DUF342 domain-containing protein [Acetivibrio clariflavus]|uniref:Putative polymerase with PALM domain, HD hydrolase domain and Zn ribbon n=1 Tax=Acetivibrio clariflavus (strain DSM 19732 / NBRC 101661 / EBR45) TaxID=720554 RepID=G8LYT1_ACECE|nr:FapA family protein [Acetivibrio clariflavus]AEV66799.1 putative polymerase with PALM domain, HD hydrolase domain and Zn ribbon [Acetivibrio clariflavus DSM 19732]
MPKDEIIYSSEFIKIIRKENDFFIESYKKGMSINEFNEIIIKYPNIKIVSFLAIKNAILFAPKPMEKFGELKERISVIVSKDELKAYVKLSVPENELIGNAKQNLVKEIMEKLKENRIIFGIKNDVLVGELCNNKQILIAEGIPPENGEDSIIKMYELKEIKPAIKEDGKVDYYELSLINKVQAGDWLGERIDSTPGIPGRTVRGKIIEPIHGKNHPLEYDRNSVGEKYENGITTLYALRSGAVHYEGDRISVSNHLEIPGDVDFKVGNINFDGYVTIKGTVEDNFIVKATKDIEILGDFGIGSVRKIESTNGSISIKGGIAGKNKAVIKCKGDLYTKFVSEATIICEGSVYIGGYCINSNITAKEIIVDSPIGRIIGGNIQAEIRVVSSILGSSSESKAAISVKGFNRDELKEKLETIINEIENMKNDMEKLKQEISQLSLKAKLTDSERNRFIKAQSEFFNIKNKIKELENDKRIITNALRTKGEGEVTVLKRIYPGVVLEIKNIMKRIDKPILTTSFYIQNGEIKQL